jgi:hypothetical protein
VLQIRRNGKEIGRALFSDGIFLEFNRGFYGDELRDLVAMSLVVTYGAIFEA